MKTWYVQIKVTDDGKLMPSEPSGAKNYFNADTIRNLIKNVDLGMGGIKHEIISIQELK